MPNFNSIREIDLNDYLPEVLKNIVEFKTITDIETEAVKKLWTACENSMDDQFVMDATVSGVARREKMLGIVPFATDTLDDRKFRLSSYYIIDVPYTRLKLKQMLSALCGETGYTITFGAHSCAVRVSLTAKKQVGMVQDLLERVLPANMAYSVELLFSTWANAAAKTWQEASALTWQELKEEVSA